jgi:hypothetical protein
MEALDISTVVIECAVLFAVVKPRIRRCLRAHVGSISEWRSFQITFTPNLVAYAAFIDWRPRIERGPVALSLRWLSTRTGARPTASWAIAMLLLMGNPIPERHGRLDRPRISRRACVCGGGRG